MNQHTDSYQKRRLRSSYLSVVISISLVLFLTGLLSLVILKTTELSKHFKEKIVLNIFLQDSDDPDSIVNFQKQLQQKEYTQKIDFISKEKAAEMMKKELGQDFVAFIGTNPLKDVVNLHLKSEYVNTDKMEKIQKELSSLPEVYEVTYDKSMIELLNKNIKAFGMWTFGLSALLTIIAVVLINSAIRLSVYSKRFTIKTMQMVGATKSFIRKPFIKTGVKLGIAGSVLAMLGIIALSYYVDSSIGNLHLFKDYKILGITFLIILVLGVLITWISTYFATRKFLNLRTEELYY